MEYIKMDYNLIWEQIKGQAEKASPIGGTIKFEIDEYRIHVDGTGDKNVLTLSDDPAECTISTTEDVLIRLKNKELNPMTALMTKKIKVLGNMGLALKLQTLLSGVYDSSL